MNNMKKILAAIGGFASGHKKMVTTAAILLAAGAAGITWYNTSGPGARGKHDQSQTVVNTAVATRGDMSSEITSSGTLSAKDSYNITALVSGTIVQADFEEGDTVEKDQVMYVIDASTMQSELKSASNSLSRAQASYEDAQKEYEDAQAKYGDGTYKATRSGYIKKLHIESGDKLSGGTSLADIYNEKLMRIKIPFLAMETPYIAAGSGAVITLSASGEQIWGTVSSVSNMDEVLDGGRIVRYVTFQVENPGGLTTEMAATATLGSFVSAGEGTFEAWTDTTMNADLDTSVEIDTMLVHEGDYVSEGTPIFRMTQTSADKLMRYYKDSLDSAEEKVDTAQQHLDETQDNYEEYTVKAPIAGRVITKTYKVGDKIGSGTSGSTTLAVIYDMSSYTFEMSVDELDISSVKAGQTVRVEADAFDGQTFYGKVTNVSLVSKASNGVSTYPVTVTLDETYDLLPGMNVDGYIVVGSATDAILIPSDSLMRGDTVYVKDDTVTETNGTIPAGFRAVKVETGLVGEDYVEIISGIEEGDVVYVPESSATTTFWDMGYGGGPGGGDGRHEGGGHGGGGDRP